MATTKDILDVKHILEPLLGQRSWGVSLGHGSFLTIEFGKPLQKSDQNDTVHGEWHLWVYGSAWRIETKEAIVVACEDPRENLEKMIEVLQDIALKNIEFSNYGWDTTFVFEGNIRLRLFTISLYETSEHWMLFMPNSEVLCIGPGLSWSCELEEA